LSDSGIIDVVALAALIGFLRLDRIGGLSRALQRRLGLADLVEAWIDITGSALAGRRFLRTQYFPDRVWWRGFGGFLPFRSGHAQQSSGELIRLAGGAELGGGARFAATAGGRTRAEENAGDDRRDALDRALFSRGKTP